MEPDRTFVMLDPATDQLLDECSGPTADGRSPVADSPPYICAGLHLVIVGGALGQDVSFTAFNMEPGHRHSSLAREASDAGAVVSLRR